MAQDNSNSTMEMGTSDQGLVASKKSGGCLKFVLTGAAVMIVSAVAITLVVVLSGNEGGSADAVVSTTTEGPSTVVTTTTQATTTTEGTTTPTTVAPPVGEIDLNSTIDGLYTPSSFDAVWSSETDLFFRNEYGDLVLYDITTGNSTTLVQNTSVTLQQATRVTQLSSDETQVILSHGVVPLFRYSFLARYTSVDTSSGDEVDIIPISGLRNDEAYLQNFVWGPTGTQFAYVYLNNIYYQTSLNATPTQITSNGVLNVIYNGVPDWVYEEEVFASNNALWFSPSGERLAYATFDDNNVRVMKVPHYGVPGSVDYQYTQHHEIRYPKPGTTNPTVTVTLRDLDNNNSNIYNAPTNLDQPILKAVRFATNDTIAVMWTNRVQTSMVVVLCTLGQAACTQIYQYDEPQGWIDGNPLIFNSQGTSFLTILPQSVNGVRYKQVVEVSNVNNVWTAADRTNTAHAVAEIMTWTDDNTIWYKASGVEEPAEQHVYSVTAGGVVSCFTCAIRRPDGAECLYNDGTASADASFITVNCAGPNVPQILIFNSNHSIVRVWDDNAELVELVSDRVVPETIRLSVQLADGVPPADVQIQVPAGYETRTNVPLLINVYGGPDTSMVTKQWGIDWGTSLVSRWGVAVAHVDGRGAGSRGVDNMFQINRRLGTYEVDDQIAATRYLQQNLTWVDANRTCIWGWSYGGYAASLALARGPDVFRCAAAVAPVVDWRFYDTIYTERYMDTPQNNPEGYANSSLLTDDVVEAYRSKNYFLIHGTADDNVHYQHAMLISRLLQRRDVYFTQMSYTDEDHSLNGVRRHLYHGLEKFLQENML